MDADIRWKQRLANFRKVFGRLDDAVLLSRQRDLSDLERQVSSKHEIRYPR